MLQTHNEDNFREINYPKMKSRRRYQNQRRASCGAIYKDYDDSGTAAQENAEKVEFLGFFLILDFFYFLGVFMQFFWGVLQFGNFQGFLIEAFLLQRFQFWSLLWEFSSFPIFRGYCCFFNFPEISKSFLGILEFWNF